VARLSPVPLDQLYRSLESGGRADEAGAITCIDGRWPYPRLTAAVIALLLHVSEAELRLTYMNRVTMTTEFTLVVGGRADKDQLAHA
jgi:hypothetical protein